MCIVERVIYLDVTLRNLFLYAREAMKFRSHDKVKSDLLPTAGNKIVCESALIRAKLNGSCG